MTLTPSTEITASTSSRWRLRTRTAYSLPGLPTTQARPSCQWIGSCRPSVRSKTTTSASPPTAHACADSTSASAALAIFSFFIRSPFGRMGMRPPPETKPPRQRVKRSSLSLLRSAAQAGERRARTDRLRIDPDLDERRLARRARALESGGELRGLLDHLAMAAESARVRREIRVLQLGAGN